MKLFSTQPPPAGAPPHPTPPNLIVNTPPEAAQKKSWWIKHRPELLGGSFLAFVALITEQAFLTNFQLDLSLFIFDIKSVSLFFRNVAYLVFFALFLVPISASLALLFMIVYQVASLFLKNYRGLRSHLSTPQFIRFKVIEQIVNLEEGKNSRIKLPNFIIKIIPTLVHKIELHHQKQEKELELLGQKMRALDAELAANRGVESTYKILTEITKLEFWSGCPSSYKLEHLAA